MPWELAESEIIDNGDTLDITFRLANTEPPPAPVTVLSKTDLMFSPGPWLGRASIVTRPDGIQVMAFKSASAHHINDGALHLSFNDGTGWTTADSYFDGSPVSGFPMNPPLSPNQDAGEPWLFYAPNGDLLLHMWRVDYGSSIGGTWQSRSIDGGQSWSSPSQVTFVGLQPEQQPRIVTTCDTFNLDGTIYAFGRVHWDANLSNASAVLCRSTDNGATWDRTSTIKSGDALEVGAEYVGGDRIVAVIRDKAHQKTYVSESNDRGLTWTTTTASSHMGLVGRPRIYTRSHLRGEAEWWTDPKLVMVGFTHQQSGSSHPRRNCVWISDNSGTTWSSPIYIDDQFYDGGYGDITHISADEYRIVSYVGESLSQGRLREYKMRLT